MTFNNQNRGGGRPVARQPQRGNRQQQSNSKVNWTELKCGALWYGKNDSFSGTISVNGQDFRVVAFVNQYKEEDKHPDYQIFFAPDNEQEARPAARQTGPRQVRGGGQTRQVRRPAQQVEEQEVDDGTNFLDENPNL